MGSLYRGQSRKKRSRTLIALGIAACLASGACNGTSGPGPARRAPVAGPTPSPTDRATPESERADGQPQESSKNRWVTERPEWLGTRVLPLGPSGMGIAKPTPPLLRNRRFATIDILPTRHRGYRATIGPVPSDVVERSTWRPKCPVDVDDLAYLTMTFWGFDRERHTGEMIVNASVADDIGGIFEALYRARFPIEEMRVTTLEEQRDWNRAPTGDTNVTSSFECRKATGGSDWSEHAYGLAIDINPFHNPYLLGDIVGPELAGAYTDRTWRRPGMIFEGDVVTRAFDAIGWEWGGRWNSLKDWMHFSASGH